MSNAIKVAPRGSEIAVTLDREMIGGVVIRVTDRGPGIAHQDLERVMQPFVQIANRSGTAPPGSGFGLPLTRTFLRLHGGDIELISTLGTGTTALIRVPADRVLPPAEVAA